MLEITDNFICKKHCDHRNRCGHKDCTKATKEEVLDAVLKSYGADELEIIEIKMQLEKILGVCIIVESGEDKPNKAQ